MRHLRLMVIALALPVVVAIAVPCDAGRPFTNRSFNGSYAMDATGSFRSGAVSLTMVGTGILSSKGDGSLDATMMMMDASIVCNVALNGSYTVQPNGSGSGSLTIASGSPANGVCDKFAKQQVSFAFVLIGRHSANKIKLSLTNNVFTLLGIGESQ